jgi:transposase
MAMGTRDSERQEPLWVAATSIARSPGHPFYDGLNRILDEAGFDEFVEKQCAPFYAERMGRPSLPPAVYFRMQMIGYFEGIDSERGIAWRVADSLALREFLGYELQQRTPDHSTISRNRRLIDLETHREVFIWVLQVLAEKDLLEGKTLGVDSTTLEANAALRSIVRRDTGEAYEEFLTTLAQESGIETPTRQDLAKLDRKRKGKGSNDDWKNPHDPDATITKMKDGRTHLAHKSEHVVDMSSGAVVAVAIDSAIAGDTQTVRGTLQQAVENLLAVSEKEAAGDKLADPLVMELVADKGYHSNEVLTDLQGLGIRTYISEPDRGRRNWKGKAAEQNATYGNRRRTRRAKGQALQKQRGELLERPVAHCYGRGGLRRTHLRGRANINKRAFIHVAGCNLGLVMHHLFGAGTPKGLSALATNLTTVSRCALEALGRLASAIRHAASLLRDLVPPPRAFVGHAAVWAPNTTFTTGC